MFAPHSFEEKGIEYDTRVLIGNWWERKKLAEFLRDRGFRAIRHLERHRIMLKTINAPMSLAISQNKIHFGDKIMVISPYTQGMHKEDKTLGVALGTRISPNYLPHAQDFRPNFRIIGYRDLEPKAKNTFVITNPNPCSTDEVLKYNQPFSLSLAVSTHAEMPLHVRYIPDPMPAVSAPFPLDLCDDPQYASQWQILPVKRPGITRFEQEGLPVPPNEDIIINHCSTNVNLGIRFDIWIRDYVGYICVPIVKTYLDQFRREQKNNIWRLHTELPKYLND